MRARPVDLCTRIKYAVRIITKPDMGTTDVQTGSGGDGWWIYLWLAAKLLYRFVTHPEISAIASLIGAILSGYVLWTVADIRRRFQFQVRGDAILEELEQSASNLSNLLQSFDANKQAIEEELAMVLENLKTLRDKVYGDAKKTTKQAIDALDAIRRAGTAPMTKEIVWKAYVEIRIAIKAARNLRADIPVE